MKITHSNPTQSTKKFITAKMLWMEKIGVTDAELTASNSTNLVGIFGSWYEEEMKYMHRRWIAKDLQSAFSSWHFKNMKYLDFLYAPTPAKETFSGKSPYNLVSDQEMDDLSTSNPQLWAAISSWN